MRRAVVIALAASCAPALPKTPVREVELPAAFDGAGSGTSVAKIAWTRYFGDAQLVALIGEALRDNFDLQLAVQRIELARIEIGRISGARLPQVALAAGAGVRKYPRYTVDGAGNLGTEIAPGQPIPTHVPDFSFGVQASWEADLWHRLGSAEGAARVRYLESVEGHHLVATALIADVATAYFSLAALDATAAVLDQTLARQTQALDMMRVEKQAGQTNELAVGQFAAQLAGTQAIAARTRADRRALELQLGVLLGRASAPIATDPQALAAALPGLALGVPSDLLHTRPDIRAAELEVRAARLDVAAARAAFYPHLRISADLGYEAFDPRFLVRTPASLAYSLVGGLVAPLINRSGIAAAFRAATTGQVSAMISYQAAVLRGFAEAAAALSTLQRSAEIVAREQQKQDALADSVAAANELFRAGKATYLDVLLAEQQTLQAQLDLVTARRDQQIAKVRLYEAVGGGWDRQLDSPLSR